MKELLEKYAKGETTIDDVLKAIDDADKDKVPRSRLNDKIEDLKELGIQLKDRDDQLVDLGKKAKGNEDLTSEINRLKQENTDKDVEYQGKLQKQAFDAKLSDALRDAKAKNPKAVKALLDATTIKLDGDKLLGLDEQLTSLKESDGYLFVETQEPAGLQGRSPKGAQITQSGISKEKFNEMNYQERVKLYQENPDAYSKLNS